METPLERILTNSYKADIISYLKAHPEDFEEAIKLAISDKQPYSWRAAWALWSCVEKNDNRIRKYTKEIINALATRNDNQQRELLILLQQMEIDEENEGKLFSICVDVWEKINKQPSLRYNAFKLIAKIAKKHPDLHNEITLLTENRYMDSLSDTVKKSIQKLIEGLQGWSPHQ